MATFTYSADNVFLTIGGFPINGFQDGSEIAITMDEDVVSKQVDIDGKNVTFNKLNNNTATVSFSLLALQVIRPVDEEPFVILST